MVVRREAAPPGQTMEKQILAKHPLRTRGGSGKRGPGRPGGRFSPARRCLMKRSEDRAQALWRAALACFVIAGASGALLRFGFLYGLPRGIDASHLRHAHSHFMYFSWATPAIAALMIAA